MKKVVKKAEGPKLVSKAALLRTRATNILGKWVRFKSPSTGRLIRGQIKAISNHWVGVSDRNNVSHEVEWEKVYEL